ncbi:TetR family transcriptional regulator [Nesterenkonia lutea]|uniref:AcrR family transcriptional regulator n=1 Tax=Nesterenkonia lutea TaxID=272919 RepID=A0ABR9JHH6_9MICC|nr:TetR family transcriptional regulator [Nesterenkonia lutea]MBE1525349.1 AcrR family transcriptional regulator [Nesterenkonia lutea]
MSQRERNQLQSWNAIHRAAFELARTSGPGAATVDEIAARAGVSRRTFFNYFPVKEDAVLGTRSAELDPLAVERFHASAEDELTRVVHLFVAVVRTCLPEETAASRRRIIAEHPHLRARLAELLAQVEQLVHGAVHAEAEQGGLRLPGGGGEHAFEALLILAGGITKFTFTRYHESESASLDPFISESIAQFRNVMENTR